MHAGNILLGVFLLGTANSYSVKNNYFDLKSHLEEQASDDYIRTGNDVWHIHVTMHVYSGRPDPTWMIPYSHPAYNVIIRNMQEVFAAKPLPSKLGYKGFSLIHIPKGGNVANGAHFNRTVTLLPEWELYLLQTADGITDDLRKHAKNSILKQTVTGRKRRYVDYPDYDLDSLFYKPSKVDPINSLSNNDMLKLAKIWGLDKRFKNITIAPPSLGPTKFEPHKWNERFVKKHNNCYNYANNRITDTFAQPGRAGSCEGMVLSNGTNVEKRAKCDGLKPVFAANSNALPHHKWNLVALVFWPPTLYSDSFDFHWYRLDGDGHWSHKPGKTSATKLDQSGNLITDPRYADRGPYTEFVGFLETRLDKVILI